MHKKWRHLIYREASHEIAQSFTVKECSVWRGVVGYLQQGTVAVNYATIKQKLPQLQVIAVPESSSHLSERVAERRRAGTRENCGDHVLKQLHNTWAPVGLDKEIHCIALESLWTWPFGWLRLCRVVWDYWLILQQAILQIAQRNSNTKIQTWISSTRKFVNSKTISKMQISPAFGHNYKNLKPSCGTSISSAGKCMQNLKHFQILSLHPRNLSSKSISSCFPPHQKLVCPIPPSSETLSLPSPSTHT